MAAILGQVGVVCRPLFYLVFLSHLHPLVSLLLPGLHHTVPQFFLFHPAGFTIFSIFLRVFPLVHSGGGFGAGYPKTPFKSFVISRWFSHGCISLFCTAVYTTCMLVRRLNFAMRIKESMLMSASPFGLLVREGISFMFPIRLGI